MPSWTSASQVPELMALLSGQPVDVTSTGGADVQLPQMPPMGNQAPLPEMPPMGGQVNMPEMPQMPTPQMPTPQAPTQQTPLPQMPTPSGPGTTTQPYNLPQTGPTTTNQQQGVPKTWLVESIVATAASSMCCGIPFIGLIPGFVAIYHAFGAKTKIKAGDLDGANKKAASAKKWLLITVAVGAAAAIYGAFTTLQNTNITDVINDIENGDTPFFYGLPK